ncbi:MAG: hypothetical protein PHH49_05600 [Candidatus Omnitrophica bacterium]|nr:hypothetical protein [Candidatus Omnitrophota bacterium]
MKISKCFLLVALLVTFFTGTLLAQTVGSAVAIDPDDELLPLKGISILPISGNKVAIKIALKDALKRDWNFDSYGSTSYSPTTCTGGSVKEVVDLGGGKYKVNAVLTFSRTSRDPWYIDYYGENGYTYSYEETVEYIVDAKTLKVNSLTYAPDSAYNGQKITVTPGRELRTNHRETKTSYYSYIYDLKAVTLLSKSGQRTEEKGRTYSITKYGTTEYRSTMTWSRKYDSEGKYPTSYVSLSESYRNGVKTSSYRQEMTYSAGGYAKESVYSYESVSGSNTYTGSSREVYNEKTHNLELSEGSSRTISNGVVISESRSVYRYDPDKLWTVISGFYEYKTLDRAKNIMVSRGSGYLYDNGKLGMSYSFNGAYGPGSAVPSSMKVVIKDAEGRSFEYGLVYSVRDDGLIEITVTLPASMPQGFHPKRLGQDILIDRPEEIGDLHTFSVNFTEAFGKMEKFIPDLDNVEIVDCQFADDLSVDSIDIIYKDTSYKAFYGDDGECRSVLADHDMDGDIDDEDGARRQEVLDASGIEAIIPDLDAVFLWSVHYNEDGEADEIGITYNGEEFLYTFEEIADMTGAVLAAKEEVDWMVYDESENEYNWYYDGGVVEDYIKLIGVEKQEDGEYKVLVGVDDIEFTLYMYSYSYNGGKRWYVSNVEVSFTGADYQALVRAEIAALLNCDAEDVVIEDPSYWGFLYNRTEGTISWNASVISEKGYIYLSGDYDIATQSAGMEQRTVDGINAVKADVALNLGVTEGEVRIVQAYSYSQVTAVANDIYLTYTAQYAYRSGQQYITYSLSMAVVDNVELLQPAKDFICRSNDISSYDLKVVSYSLGDHGDILFTMEDAEGNTYTASVDIATGKIILTDPDHIQAEKIVADDAQARDWNLDLMEEIYPGEDYQKKACKEVSILSIKEQEDGTRLVTARVSLDNNGYTETRLVEYVVDIASGKCISITVNAWPTMTITREGTNKEVITFERSGYDCKVTVTYNSSGTRYKQEGVSSREYTAYDGTVTTEATTWLRYFNYNTDLPTSCYSRMEKKEGDEVVETKEVRSAYFPDGTMSSWSEKTMCYKDYYIGNGEYQERKVITDESFSYYQESGRMSSEYTREITRDEDGRTMSESYKNANYSETGQYTYLYQYDYENYANGKREFYNLRSIYINSYSGEREDRYENLRYNEKGVMTSEYRTATRKSAEGITLYSYYCNARYDDDGRTQYLDSYTNYYWANGRLKSSYSNDVYERSVYDSTTGEYVKHVVTESSSRSLYENGRTSSESASRRVVHENGVTVENYNKSMRGDENGNITYLSEYEYTYYPDRSQKSYYRRDINTGSDGRVVESKEEKKWNENGDVIYENNYEREKNADGVVVKEYSRTAEYDEQGACTYLYLNSVTRYDNGRDKKRVRETISTSSSSSYRDVMYSEDTYNESGRRTAHLYKHDNWASNGIKTSQQYENSRWDDKGALVYTNTKNVSWGSDGKLRSVTERLCDVDWDTGIKRDEEHRAYYNTAGVITSNSENSSCYDANGDWVYSCSLTENYSNGILDRIYASMYVVSENAYGYYSSKYYRVTYDIEDGSVVYTHVFGPDGKEIEELSGDGYTKPSEIVENMGLDIATRQVELVDVDQDGDIDADDLYFMKNLVSAPVEITEDMINDAFSGKGDINGDGKTDYTDKTLVAYIDDIYASSSYRANITDGMIARADITGSGYSGDQVEPDGAINSNDYYALYNHVAGYKHYDWIEEEVGGYARGDVDMDGDIDWDDVYLVNTASYMASRKITTDMLAKADLDGDGIVSYDSDYKIIQTYVDYITDNYYMEWPSNSQLELPEGFGTDNWVSQNGTASEWGGFAAQSGPVAAGESSFMEKVVTFDQDSDLSFMWKKSGYSTDKLNVYIDGVLEATVDTSSSNWNEVVLAVAAGTHTIRWEYDRTASTYGNYNYAWVDDIKINGELLDNFEPDMKSRVLEFFANADMNDDGVVNAADIEIAIDTIGMALVAKRAKDEVDYLVYDADESYSSNAEMEDYINISLIEELDNGNYGVIINVGDIEFTIEIRGADDYSFSFYSVDETIRDTSGFYEDTVRAELAALLNCDPNLVSIDPPHGSFLNVTDGTLDWDARIVVEGYGTCYLDGVYSMSEHDATVNARLVNTINAAKNDAADRLGVDVSEVKVYQASGYNTKVAAGGLVIGYSFSIDYNTDEVTETRIDSITGASGTDLLRAAKTYLEGLLYNGSSVNLECTSYAFNDDGDLVITFDNDGEEVSIVMSPETGGVVKNAEDLEADMAIKARRAIDWIVSDDDEPAYWYSPDPIEDYIELIDIVQLENGNYMVECKVDDLHFKVEVGATLNIAGYYNWTLKNAGMMDEAGNLPGKYVDAIKDLLNCSGEDITFIYDENISYSSQDVYDRSDGLVFWQVKVKTGDYSYMYIDGAYDIATMDPGIESSILAPVTAVKEDMEEKGIANEDIVMIYASTSSCTAKANGLEFYFRMNYTYKYDYEKGTYIYTMTKVNLAGLENADGVDLYYDARKFAATEMGTTYYSGLECTDYSLTDDGKVTLTFTYGDQTQSVDVDTETGEVTLPQEIVVERMGEMVMLDDDMEDAPEAAEVETAIVTMPETVSDDTGLMSAGTSIIYTSTVSVPIGSANPSIEKELESKMAAHVESSEQADQSGSREQLEVDAELQKPGVVE